MYHFLFLCSFYFLGIKKDELIQPSPDATALNLIFSSTFPVISDSDK